MIAHICRLISKVYHTDSEKKSCFLAMQTYSRQKAICRNSICFFLTFFCPHRKQNYLSVFKIPCDKILNGLKLPGNLFKTLFPVFYFQFEQVEYHHFKMMMLKFHFIVRHHFNVFPNLLFFSKIEKEIVLVQKYFEQV